MKTPARILIISLISLFITCGISLSAQDTETKVNYNEVYRFPVSIGAEVQFLSPLELFGTDYKGDFTIMDISTLARFPIPSVPVLQPLARLGFTITKANFHDGFI